MSCKARIRFVALARWIDVRASADEALTLSLPRNTSRVVQTPKTTAKGIEAWPSEKRGVVVESPL